MTATPATGPFLPNGKVAPGAWPLSPQEAVAAAQAAGFRVTSRSDAKRIVAHRDWMTEVTISPTPAGVVVKRTLTVAQLAMVGAVIVLLVVLCGPNVAPL